MAATIDRNYCKTQFKDEWKDVPGPWSLTRHAYNRLLGRYQLNQDQIEDMLENLDRENVVRVLCYNEQPNSYTVQTAVDGKGLFLIVELGTKRIITVLTPYFQFPGELTSVKFEVAQLDTTWSDCGEGFECVEEIVRGNVKPSEDDHENDLELTQKALLLANNRIRELERELTAIKQICIVGLEGGGR